MAFPTEAQARVINHRGGPLVVVAGPGTGKTSTLVERMISLLKEDQSREVTFITFTRTSRHDTETKLIQAFGDAVLKNPDLLFPRTSTFHTYAKRLVHKFSHVINREATFSILIDSKGERDIIVEELSFDLGIPIDPTQLSASLAAVRATGEWPLGFPLALSRRQEALFRLDELLRLYNTYDMEGVVLAAREILQSSEAALPQVFLQVDEYQDLNPSDQKCLELLTSHKASQVAVVGDDAQSIYGFRFANYQGVRSLWNSEGWERIRFEDSHRLPAHVLNAALDLIDGRGYLGADIHRKPDTARRITALQCTGASLQVEAVAQDIKTRMAQNDAHHLTFKDFLVLCPTKAQARQTASSLADEFGLPARTPSRSSIPDDYWQVVLILRIADNDDPLALRQWLPALHLAGGEIRRLRYSAMNSGGGFAQTCYDSGDPRIQALHEGIKRIRHGAQDPVSLVEALRGLQGLQIPDELPALLLSQTKADGHLPRLGHLIQLIYERFGVLDPEEAVSHDDSILVTTMHAAKGLEASIVYATWMNSTFMPTAERDPEEERRVLYVALTRAKQDVVITYHEQYDSVRHRLLKREVFSPFLEEIAPRLSFFRANVAAIRSTPPLWLA